MGGARQRSAEAIERRNARAGARLLTAPAPLPPVVLHAALARTRVPDLPSRAVAEYWQAHPLRADRLARALAARSAAPAGWGWQVDRDGAGGLGHSFRTPPAPYREDRYDRGPGCCSICGQPVFRFGWHVDLWSEARPNRRARWHSACVAAWKLWSAPGEHARLLKRRQRYHCAETGRRLMRGAEVDHRVPLFKVWREHRDAPWPELLGFWGGPNLQVVNRDAHARKCAEEAAERAGARRCAPVPPPRDREAFSP